MVWVAIISLMLHFSYNKGAFGPPRKVFLSSRVKGGCHNLLARSPIGFKTISEHNVADTAQHATRFESEPLRAA